MSESKKVQTKSDCPVCKDGTKIIAETKKFFLSNVPPIDGPEGEDQWVDKKTLFCEKCGVQFYSLPQD